jgi:hypothetical protein
MGIDQLAGLDAKEREERERQGVATQLAATQAAARVRPVPKPVATDAPVPAPRTYARLLREMKKDEFQSLPPMYKPDFRPAPVLDVFVGPPLPAAEIQEILQKEALNVLAEGGTRGVMVLVHAKIYDVYRVVGVIGPMANPPRAGQSGAGKVILPSALKGYRMVVQDFR